MDTVNNFNGGMESDLSKQLHKPNTYLQALNFRGINEINSSTGSLVNIKGNECKITFPDLQPVFKLIVTEGSDDISDNTVDFEINGTTVTGFTLSNTTTGFDIYSFIINNFTECYQNTSTGTKTFAVAYEDNYVVLYNQPVYQDCSTVASIPTEIVLTQTTTDGTKALLYFVNKDIPNSLTQNNVDPYVSGVISSLIKPIGSTFILNDIYILTATDNPAYGPAGAVGEIPANDELKFGGAIWKLNIDDTTKQHTLTLVYSNNLDFTKYHPIPPSAITGRYESKEIQRIYWSDNYNKIRTLNITVPQLMALNPNLLSVMPKVKFIQPILNSIGIGVLPVGSYQLSYKLSKTLGVFTNFSELSNPVYLVPSPESDPFQDYESGFTNTAKSIEWKLTGLDTDFDIIEPVVIYKSSANGVPSIVSLGVKTLLPIMNITLADLNATGNTELTLDEFVLFNGTFTHAKTCDTKDNRLFWGNVRAPKKELEAFDARAFRANDNGDIVLMSDQIFNTWQLSNPNGADYAGSISQTQDTINEYYDPVTGDYSTNACYLDPLYATTTKILGGRGVNISYEFGTEIFESDSNARSYASEGWDMYNNQTGSPYRLNGTTGAVNKTLIGGVYDYPQNNKFNSLKQPERTSLLKGFQHEEIYRFGIQFFDLEQNPYFTKWIGDIKMPSYGDYNNNPGGAVSDFSLGYQSGNSFISQILYIKFTLDLTSVQDLIGGYQIVRVKRESIDKTIKGVGLITPFMSLNGDGDTTGSSAVLAASWNETVVGFDTPIYRPYYRPYPSQEHVETLNLNNDTVAANSNFSRYKSFDCFDFDTGDVPSFDVSDRLLVRTKVDSINYRSPISAYRQFFGKGEDSSGLAVPGIVQNIDNGTLPNPGTGWIGVSDTNYDSGNQAFFIFKLNPVINYCTYSDFLSSNSNPYDYTMSQTEYILGNTSTSMDGYTINNNGQDLAGSTGNPCGGKQTLILNIRNNKDNSFNGLYTSSFPYLCKASTVPFSKLIALYYKPNSSQYGGNTYVQRTLSEYIPCGEYVPIEKHVNLIPKQVFGGDVFTGIYDCQKTFRGAGADYYYYDYSGGGPVAVQSAKAVFSSTFFIPCTSYKNMELRYGDHINKSLDIGSYAFFPEDQYDYGDYCNAENDTKVYFPKPLEFQTTNEWINRIYWSELKFNNETRDSWSEYLTDSFYDVEGNYGGINALVSLKESMYYLQERGVGSLMINPVSLINDSLGQSVKLGGSAPNSPVIQKHYYKAIDAGTFHQWSVYRSQSAITFVDARHKKIYLFDGESVTPISDLKGQRSFTIKRLHNELLKFDNPVINKGILATYDYYHNEFLYTFNNIKQLTSDPITYDTTNDENLTLAYSEVTNTFTGLYSFTPNLYINSNKYLISTKNSSVAPYYPSNKLWFHNYGAYGMFYNTPHKCNLKVLVNENPLYTKVFDNLTWNTESVKDNVEWNDDFNLYPGSPTNPLYVDDVNNQSDTFNKIRCYNDWQNTDWSTLTLAPPNNNLTRKERNFNLQIPRNKFNYDSTAPSIVSIFNPANLTKIYFGERMRDKYLIVDLEYPNTTGNRFIIHNLKTQYRISDR